MIFDLDGTIYFGDTVAPFAHEVIQELREKLSYEVIFLTNNSTKKRETILKKLTNLGIKTTVDKIYTSAFATGKYLLEHSIENVYVIGSSEFKKELREFGIRVLDSKNVDAVVIGLDLDFDYNKIATALEAVLNGALIIASNVDANYPIENGVLRPGCNAIVASLLGTFDYKREVDYIVGKPNTYLLDIICHEHRLDKSKILIVGDSLESDIAMANNYGVDSFLVSGESTLLDIMRVIKKE